MKQAIIRNKKYFGYILYGFILTIGLLYYHFPSEIFRDYLQSNANTLNPKLILSIAKVNPSFPFGLNLLEPRVSLKTDPQIMVFKAENLFIKPDLWSYLKGESKYNFDCPVNNTKFNGDICSSKGNAKTSFTASVAIENVRIENITHLSGLVFRNLGGVLAGTITYSGQYNSLIEGTGQASLKISDGHVEFLHPFLNHGSIAYNKLSIKMDLKNNKIDLKHVELIGREIQGSLSGIVVLKRPFLKSSIDLRGTIEILAGFLNNKGTLGNLRLFKQRLKKGKLSFTIRGTLTEPQFKVI